MKRTDQIENVKAFLGKEPWVNLNLFGILEHLDPAEREIYVDDEEKIGVVLVHTGYMNYLYTDDPSRLVALDPLIETFGERFGFSGVKTELREPLLARYDLDWESPCHLYVAREDHPFEVPEIAGLDRLRASDVAEVDRYYTYRNDSSYIRLRKDILRRPSVCIRLNGELRSWLLVHEDGSMGVMYTKKAYRQHGYGFALTAEMVRLLRQEGKTPFVQIVIDNDKSMRLAEKSGFRRVARVDWFGLSKRKEDK